MGMIVQLWHWIKMLNRLCTSIRLRLRELGYGDVLARIHELEPLTVPGLPPFEQHPDVKTTKPLTNRCELHLHNICNLASR
jgi:hypothetical protein